VFFGALYATLTAWGLHRIGPGNTKLRDLAQIKESFRAQASRLDGLAALQISNVGDAEIALAVDKVWSLLSRLKVSVATAQLEARLALLE
jgi:hypothetical protein